MLCTHRMSRCAAPRKLRNRVKAHAQCKDGSSSGPKIVVLYGIPARILKITVNSVDVCCANNDYSFHSLHNQYIQGFIQYLRSPRLSGRSFIIRPTLTVPCLPNQDFSFHHHHNLEFHVEFELLTHSMFCRRSFWQCCHLKEERIKWRFW